MIGKVLHTANVEHKNWKQEHYKFLKNFWETPHTDTGKCQKCFQTDCLKLEFLIL